MAEKDNQFQGVVESLLKGMDTVLSTKTVVGEATKIGDTIILPLVDVTFGVGAGAGNNSEKRSASGAGGLGGKIDKFTQPKEKEGMSDAEVVDIAFPEDGEKPSEDK